MLRWPRFSPPGLPPPVAGSSGGKQSTVVIAHQTFVIKADQLGKVSILETYNRARLVALDLKPAHLIEEAELFEVIRPYPAVLQSSHDRCGA